MSSKLVIVNTEHGKIGHQYDYFGNYIGSRILNDADFMGGAWPPGVITESDITDEERAEMLNRYSKQYWEESKAVNTAYWASHKPGGDASQQGGDYYQDWQNSGQPSCASNQGGQRCKVPANRGIEIGMWLVAGLLFFAIVIPILFPLR